MKSDWNYDIEKFSWKDLDNFLNAINLKKISSDIIINKNRDLYVWKIDELLKINKNSIKILLNLLYWEKWDFINFSDIISSDKSDLSNYEKINNFILNDIFHTKVYTLTNSLNIKDFSHLPRILKFLFKNINWNLKIYIFILKNNDIKISHWNTIGDIWCENFKYFNKSLENTDKKEFFNLDIKDLLEYVLKYWIK